MLHGLYPLPKDLAKNMAYRLLRWFQSNAGYFNTLATPFAKSFTQTSYDGAKYLYLAAMYPVIGIEDATDYRSRKAMERFLQSMQPKDPKDFPSITRARYGRRFDFNQESRLRQELNYDDIRPEAMQSARALFEYSCADADTLDLDLEQAMDIKAHDTAFLRRQLIQIEPLWVLVFPSSSE